MRPTLTGRWIAWLDARSPAARWGIVLGIVALVGIADRLTAAEVAFTLAYLLPIAIAAWHLSVVAVWIVAFASTAVSLAVDAGTPTFELRPSVEATNLVGQLLVFLFFGMALSRLRTQLDREHQLATTDALTGLANRRAFWELARHEVARGRRFHQTFSLACLDVDDFKAVNDRCGHAAGDAVLVAIARLLGSGVRAVDTVARLGGDEFALLMPGTDETGARTVLAKLRAKLAEAPWNREHRVSFSIGCVTVVDGASDFATLMGCADVLLYAVKAKGKDGQLHEVVTGAVGGAPERRGTA